MHLKFLSLTAFLGGSLYCCVFASVVAQPVNVSAPSSALAPINADDNDLVRNSVVKVFSSVLPPDLYRPWTRGSESEISGSGVVIEGHRILTNAHLVLYSSKVQIQANQAGDRISATVETIAPGIDLAILKLDDDKFFDEHPPLTREEGLPCLKDPIMVYGYPQGGDSLSITKGIISRIEFAAYNFPVSGLKIQIDAAINPGNSGGPAISGSKMVGLAFSRLGDAEDIGYIIPCEEIDLFLKSIQNGCYRGKPALYDEFQSLENSTLRSFLGLDKTVEGEVVHSPFEASDAYPLRKFDVITKIGDFSIDDQGMVSLVGGLHVRFTYLVQKLVVDGKIGLTVIRNGKEMQVEVPVLYDRPMALPLLNGSYPSYFIYGPLVFSEASRDFLLGYVNGAKGGWALNKLGTRSSPLILRSGDKPAFDGERLVVLSSPFFPDKAAQGYLDQASKVVKTVNNIPVRNLQHLVEILRDSKDEYIQIDFSDLYSETIVFRREELLAETDQILSDNDIRNQGSPDIMKIWNAKSSGGQ